MKKAERLKVGSLQLNVLDIGPRKGFPLLFLHGFPDFHYGWRKQLPSFEEQGYRLIAPDQRGYNLSDKPPEIADYRLELLGQDMLNLLDTLGIEQACVIGHDWGGATAWWLAHHHPERVKGLIVLNMPHPQVFQAHLRTSRSQLLKAWYMFFFQLPGLPEWLLSRSHYTHFGQTLKDGARRGAFSQQEIERYIAAWSQPGAFKAMLNWYRAAFRIKSRPFPAAAVKPPTLIIWGRRDPHLEFEMTEASLARCQQARLVSLPHAGHWVQDDEPEQVNDLIQDFLKRLQKPGPFDFGHLGAPKPRPVPAQE